MDHGEYSCSSCAGPSVDARIAREVYGCSAGNHCVVPTPEQRVAFGVEITKRLEEWRRTHPETT